MGLLKNIDVGQTDRRGWIGCNRDGGEAERRGLRQDHEAIARRLVWGGSTDVEDL